MVYGYDPDHRIYASHDKSKVVAISEAVRKFEPLRPVIRASVMRDIWMQMTQRGYSLEERPS